MTQHAALTAHLGRIEAERLLRVCEELFNRPAASECLDDLVRALREVRAGEHSAFSFPSRIARDDHKELLRGLGPPRHESLDVHRNVLAIDCNLHAFPTTV